MQTKRLLVLANSLKKGDRCVAGRELSGPNRDVGAWCRPISELPEGELRPKDMRLTAGGPLKPLHVVDVPLERNVNDPLHPEDWLVTGAQWAVVDTVSSATLTALIETPQSLWLEPHRSNDRVSSGWLSTTPHHQSLYLIRPTNLEFHYGYEWDNYNKRDKRKRRARFTYNGIRYDFSLTDPEASDAYCTNFPMPDEPWKSVVPGCAGNCVLCVSLTPALRGVHYKVVATLLALS